jgi:small subunit ribosomal protein S24e
MEVKIASQTENPLLKRREIRFQVEHPASSSPPRLEVRKALAAALKSNVDLVFVMRFETKTGTQTAVGTANLYESTEQARLVEPDYVINRNVPLEKPEEEAKEQK